MDNTPDIDIAEERSERLLSLEALDLSIPPSTSIPWLKKNADLLWKNKTSFPDGKDNFEFVIKPKVGSDEDIATQESTHIQCYICNTFVPKTYIIEHVNSSKHLAFQKIAETALERARKHKKMIGIEQMKNKLEYFCEHCVSVIHLSNRNEHEKSRLHKNYAALDIFLSNFALFYTNNVTGNIDYNISKSDATDISPLKVNAKVLEDVNEQNVDFEFIPLKINDDDIDTHIPLDKKTSDLENKLNSSVVLIGAIETCLDNTLQELNNNVPRDDQYEKADIVANLDQYIKRLKMYGNVNLQTVDSFNQDVLKILTSDGSELVVPILNFHGFKKIGKFFQCKLCVSVVANAAEHRLHEKHMKIVAQPFVDKHCIRQLQDPLSHCVVCNEVIDNTIVHTHFNKHVRKLEQSLVPTANICDNPTDVSINDNAMDLINTEKDIPEAPKSDVNETEEENESTNSDVLNVNTNKMIVGSQHYCLLCNKYMHVNNVEKHMVGVRHTVNSKSLIYYIMHKDKNNILTCKVCNTTVQYYTWAVENHIESASHVENYNNCLAINKIDKIEDGFFCKPCEQKLHKRNELTHIGMQSHKVKLASYNINCIYQNNHIKEIENECVKDNDNNEEVSTKLIEVNLSEVETSVAKSENESSNSFDKQEIEEKLCTETTVSDEIQNCKQENQNEIEPNDTASYKCSACKDVPNDASNKLNTDNAKHRTMDILLTGVNNLLEELLKYFNSPPEIHSHLRLTDVENVLNCIVCTDRVSIEETEKHTNSLKHIHKHRDLMSANKLKLKKDNYVCYACNVYVETGKELRHIETVDHENRIEELKNGDYVLITSDNKKVMDKLNRDLKIMEPKMDDAELKEITFGDFIVNVDNIKDNVTNLRHHFCELIDNDKQLICVLCQELVENTESVYRTHTNDVNHNRNYKTVMDYNNIFQIEDDFVCGFCECIIDDNEFAHVSSEEHVVSHKNNPNKNFCFTCKLSTIDTGLKEHFTSETHIKNVGLPPRFYCNICNLQIRNNTMNIHRHNEGFEHQNNYSLIDENKVILKNKKCVCQVCETTFNRDVLGDHVNSLSHMMLLHHNHYQLTSDQCSS